VGNPVDLTFEMDLTLFEQLLDIVYSSGEVDGALLYGIFGWDFMTNMEKRFPALKQIQEPWIANYEKFLARLCEQPKSYGKPLFVLSFIPATSPSIAPIIRGGVPVFPSARRAAAAMSAMLRYRQIRDSA
jgi:acyl-CoA synthetase (NDP forming)